MSSKSHGVSVSPGTVLSVFCLLLYSAGFIRIEVKYTDHEERLVAVEEVISRITKHGMVDTSTQKENLVIIDSGIKKVNDKDKAKLQRFTRSIANKTPFNSSANIKQALEDVVTSSFKKICQNAGNWNVCPRGMPGLPGRDGSKGDKGDQGKKGRKGSQGVMGQPGRSGKQGIMGPPGIRGDKGVKGDIGVPGVPGMKGEPGESISAPNVTFSPSQLTVNESTTASLICSASGNPAPQVAWFRVNGSLPSNRTKMSSEGLLQIDDVRLEDAGKYKCMARNILGREESVASLVVQSKPKVSLSFGPSYVEKGKNITLPMCHVTGFPPPKITWLKIHGRIVQARAVVKDGQLSIINAQKKDSGLYKCQASNHLGHDSAVTQINVVKLPHFTVSPPAQLEMRSTIQNVTVRCQAAGDPQPTVTWAKENGDLPAGRSLVDMDGTLKIWNTKVEDSGIYSCVASSKVVFKAFSAMKLTVKVPECHPVGVSDRNTIPDARMTATSYYDHRYRPYYARLNEGRRGWSPKTRRRTDYLQVDMGAVHFVCAVATQGSIDTNERTTSYKLRMSSNGATWNTYKENNAEKVFPGNTDRNTVVKNSFLAAAKARFVRFYYVTYNSWPAIRVEIFVLK